MQNHSQTLVGKVALVTGAARRLGEAIARTLHVHGANLVLHYNTSVEDAQRLALALNELRANLPSSRRPICSTLALLRPWWIGQSRRGDTWISWSTMPPRSTPPPSER